MSKVSAIQLAVLRRLADERFPDNQPILAETSSVDALVRRGYAEMTDAGNVRITRAGQAVLTEMDEAIQ